jgi:hypothetical protein
MPGDSYGGYLSPEQYNDRVERTFDEELNAKQLAKFHAENKDSDIKLKGPGTFKNLYDQPYEPKFK